MNSTFDLVEYNSSWVGCIYLEMLVAGSNNFSLMFVSMILFAVPRACSFSYLLSLFFPLPMYVRKEAFFSIIGCSCSISESYP
jgi:hypothetical protein